MEAVRTFILTCRYSTDGYNCACGEGICLRPDGSNISLPPIFPCSNGNKIALRARGRSIFLQFLRILGHSSYWEFAWDNRSYRTGLAVVVVVVVANLNSSWKERETHTLCVCLRAFWVFFKVGFGVPRVLGERNHHHGGAA